MKTGLVNLLNRKTKESRDRALEEEKRWRGTLSLVSQAETIAECKLTLPPELTASNIPKLRAILKADHIAAVAFTRKSVEARAQILKISEEKLSQEITDTRADIESIKKQIISLDEEHAKKKAGIKQNKEEALAKNPDYPSYAMSGCMFGFLGCVGIGLVASILMTFQSGNSKQVERAGMEYAIYSLIPMIVLGMVAYPAIKYISWEMRKSQIMSSHEKKLSSVKQKIEAKEKSLHNKMQNKSSQAQKLEAALRLINSNE